MAEFTFAPLTPASFLDRSAAVFADRIAVVDGERTFTYREMSDRCRRLTGALAAMGVGHEDRVAATARAGERGRVEQGLGGRPGGRGDADVAVQARGQHRAVVEQVDLAGQLVRVGCPGRGGQVAQEVVQPAAVRAGHLVGGAAGRGLGAGAVERAALKAGPPDA